MIFRNESNFLFQTLENIGPRVDYAIFLDSSSTDDSVHIIQTMMSGYGIPFEVHNFDQPFRGDTKRTAAIELAAGKADYLLMFDADNCIEMENIPAETWQDLTADAYYITKRCGNIDYPILALFKSDLPWKFTGIIHDYPELKSGAPFSTGHLPGVIIHEPIKDSGPRIKTKAHYYGDALIIEGELFHNGKKLTPMLIHRYTFYLAQSYRDAGMIERAIEAYNTRVMMGGWDEEVYYSLLSLARLKLIQGAEDHDVCLAYAKAWEYRPQRLESAYELMSLLVSNGFEHAAYSIGYYSARLQCDDKLFMERETYTTLFPDLFAELEKKYQIKTVN